MAKMNQKILFRNKNKQNTKPIFPLSNIKISLTSIITQIIQKTQNYQKIKILPFQI